MSDKIEFDDHKQLRKAREATQKLEIDEAQLPDELQPEFLNTTNRKKYRFFMLALCSSFVMANYFSYDNPGSLEIPIEEEFGVSPERFGLLYTMYAIPNLFLPFCAGIIYDKIGTRNGLVIFSVLLVSGQCIQMIGGYEMNYNMLFPVKFFYLMAKMYLFGEGNIGYLSC